MNPFVIKKIVHKLNFEVGMDDEILKINNTRSVKVPKNQDSALVPLKDVPKHKPLW